MRVNYSLPAVSSRSVAVAVTVLSVVYAVLGIALLTAPFRGIDVGGPSLVVGALFAVGAIGTWRRRLWARSASRLFLALVMLAAPASLIIPRNRTPGSVLRLVALEACAFALLNVLDKNRSRFKPGV